ncbi:DUF2716 domain-containing protein [Mesobacillus jeotgali]|uniref:DUF2716 domain-containing protein n=1 Tax=Mesobacillus jeotgali TaxID=129985 RepID=UPI00177F82E5|nr:DUF2716 domain-containing protein [Mesobacillus jeotgali]UYZ24415.1 DUF2716 domain-containing protein [Mesobacillus jeotgali]
MNNWIELTQSEEDKVWKQVHTKFLFKPSISAFPSFYVPNPFSTYDISRYLNGSLDLEELDFNYKDLEEKAISAFQKVTNNGEYFYSLDWQHPGYWVNPFLEFPKDEFNEWIIPIVPDGDYNFFIQEDFQWGFLGHPWEGSITIFGKELIEAFEKDRPEMFNTILRKG